MPISSQQHREKTGHFQLKQSNLLNKIKQPVSSIPDFDSSFQIPHTQDYARTGALQTRLIFSGKQSLGSSELRLLILLLLIGPTMSQTFSQTSGYSTENNDENNGVKRYLHSQELGFSNGLPIEQFSDSSILKDDLLINSDVKPLFYEEMAFREKNLYSIGKKMLPDFENIRGLCAGLTNLFSFLDPAEISKFIKDSAFRELQSEILLGYVIAIQAHHFSYKPKNNLPGRYELKLRDGSMLLAETPSGLFEKLFEKGKHAHRAVLKKIAPAEKFFSKVDRYLTEGKLYYLTTIDHAMLIQKEGEIIKLFDSNQGFLVCRNAKDLYNKIAFNQAEQDPEFYFYLWEVGGKHTKKEAKQLVSGLPLDRLDTTLYRAIASADLPTIEAALDEYFKKTDDPQRFSKFLKLAIDGKSDFKTIKLIYTKASIDVNGLVDNLDTYLTLAVIRRNLDAVNALLMHKLIDPNKLAPQGQTPLIIAANNGDADIVKLLLEKNADPNQAALNGLTPLIIAVKKRHIEVVKLLLEKNANPNQATKEGIKPLYLAKMLGDVRMVKLIEEYLSKKAGTMPFANTPGSISSKEMKNEL